MRTTTQSLRRERNSQSEGTKSMNFAAPPDTDLINFVNWATVHGITMTGSIVERVIACTNVEGNIHCRSIRKW